MTALTHRAAHRLAVTPTRWRFAPARTVWRAWAYVGLLMEVFAESQDMAREAHRRWPFVES
jgi:hypothetical protein